MSTELEKSIEAAKVANDLKDPTKPFSSFMKFNKNNTDLTLNFVKSSSVTLLVKEEIFSLFKDNMMETYIKCPWGWNEKEKRAELFHRNAR